MQLLYSIYVCLIVVHVVQFINSIGTPSLPSTKI